MQLVVLYPINLSQVYKKANELQFIHKFIKKQMNSNLLNQLKSCNWIHPFVGQQCFS